MAKKNTIFLFLMIAIQLSFLIGIMNNFDSNLTMRIEPNN